MLFSNNCCTSKHAVLLWDEATKAALGLWRTCGRIGDSARFGMQTVGEQLCRHVDGRDVPLGREDTLPVECSSVKGRGNRLEQQA